jgi:alkylation response protein AidB-like acyl-CoA dehydrogenase
MSAALETTNAAAAADPLGAIAARATALLPPLAQRIDHDGYYPVAEMQALGGEGLYGLHLATSAPRGTPDIGAAIEAMAAVGRHCMATAFCTWCQDAAGWYLENTANAALRARLQPGIATGAIMGGTGLSNPMKSFSGIEQFKLRGKRVTGGWVVSGVLPWVSNLGEGHWFGTVFTEQVRLDAAHLALAASQAGMLHAGARGYIENSPEHRRLREALFVAIVTPSIKHLRQKLAALSAH